jgi:hypothetical protein
MLIGFVAMFFLFYRTDAKFEKGAERARSQESAPEPNGTRIA